MSACIYAYVYSQPFGISSSLYTVHAESHNNLQMLTKMPEPSAMLGAGLTTVGYKEACTSSILAVLLDYQQYKGWRPDSF